MQYIRKTTAAAMIIMMILSFGIKSGALEVVNAETVRENMKIMYETEIRVDPEKYEDYEKVIAEGCVGEKEVEYIKTYVSGELVSMTCVSEHIITKPRTRIIVKGSKKIDYTATGEFMQPVTLPRQVSQLFKGSRHTGVDLAAKKGTEIYASDSGTVTFSGRGAGGYGKLLIIDHGNGMETYYAHCSKLLAEEGEKVMKGELVALLGSTGRSTGPHLHFEIRLNGEPADPADYFDYRAELNYNE